MPGSFAAESVGTIDPSPRPRELTLADISGIDLDSVRQKPGFQQSNGDRIGFFARRARYAERLERCHRPGGSPILPGILLQTLEWVLVSEEPAFRYDDFFDKLCQFLIRIPEYS